MMIATAHTSEIEAALALRQLIELLEPRLAASRHPREIAVGMALLRAALDEFEAAGHLARRAFGCEEEQAATD